MAEGKVAKQQVYVKIESEDGEVVAISGPYWIKSLEPNEKDEIELVVITA